MESSFFPVPVDVLLIPMVVLEPKAWYKKALICTVGSVCGALFGYYVGKVLYNTAGVAIVNFYNLHHAVVVIGEKYANNAFLAVFCGAFTPIPYKALTITAGMFGISLPVLVAASLLGRGGRFFIVAAALKIFGKEAQYVIEKYFNVLVLVFFVVLIAGFLVFKYLI
jgi:membrane protein YqaA with SNARE-associated domain